MRYEDKQAKNVTADAEKFSAAPEITKLSTLVMVEDDGSLKLCLVMFDNDGKALGRINLNTFEEATGFATEMAKNVWRVWPIETAQFAEKALPEIH